MDRKELDRRVAEMFPGLMSPDHNPVEYKDDGTEEVELPSGAIGKYDKDFDIVKLMEESHDPDTGLLRDLKIDDRDLRSASNYYDYVFNIIGKDAHPPWIVQMWTGLMLFAEVCPVCSNKKWLNLEWFTDNVSKSKPAYDIKEGMVLLERGVCPKCKRQKWDLYKNHGLINYGELVNVLGQRSGKSSSAAGSYFPYQTHRFLKFPRLADMTNAMQKSTELTLTFVSLTVSKAIGLIWTPYMNAINESSWFNEYFRCLDYHGEKLGVELYRKKDLFMKFYHKNIKMYPTNPRGKTLRGDTRIGALVDELGLFPLPTGNDEEDETREIANADEAHKSLTNSLVTVQAIQADLLAQGINSPPALMMGVSSPFSIRDKVMRLLEDSRTEVGKKHILGVNLPTWKVNPHLERTSPIIALAYERNPEKAERDFGANPPRVHQTFLKPGNVPRSTFSGKNSHDLTYAYDRPGLLYGKVNRHYKPRFPSIVTIDAGHANNSFTLTAGHFDFNDQKTKVSTVIELMTHDGRKIDFDPVYTNVILPIMKDVNAVALIADQWQSLDILSRARTDMGKMLINGREKDRCLSQQYSPRRKDFDALVAMIESGAYQLPFISEADYEDVCTKSIEFSSLRHQPMKHLLLQMLTVTDVGPGKCPTKGPGYTDDIFRALVLTTLIHSKAVMERLIEANNSYVKEAVAMPKAGFRGRSLSF